MGRFSANNEFIGDGGELSLLEEIWVAENTGKEIPSVPDPLDADLTAIAALGFTATAFLKKTAANTWALDTNTYLTAETDPVYTSWYNAGSPTLTALTLSRLVVNTGSSGDVTGYKRIEISDVSSLNYSLSGNYTLDENNTTLTETVASDALTTVALLNRGYVSDLSIINGGILGDVNHVLIGFLATGSTFSPSPGSTADTYAFYNSISTSAGTSHWNLYNTANSHNWMGLDNSLTYFGTGKDATITYDGTNFVVNPKVAGTGYLSVLGGIASNTLTAGRGVYVSTDGLLANSEAFLVDPSSTGNTLVVQRSGSVNVTVKSYNDTGASSYGAYSFERGRGSLSVPSIALTNDVIGAFNFYAWNGTERKGAVGFGGYVHGWNENNVIGRFGIVVADGTGPTYTRVSVTPSGVAAVYSESTGIYDTLQIHYKNAIGAGGRLGWFANGTVETARIEHSLYTSSGTKGDLIFSAYAGSLQERMRIMGAGNVGIGTSGPDAKLDILSTTEQLRLTYTDGSVYTAFTTSSAGALTIAPSGGATNVTGSLTVSGLTATRIPFAGTGGLLSDSAGLLWNGFQLTADAKISSNYGDDVPTGSHQLYLRSRTPSIRLQALRPRVGDVGAAFNAFEFYAQNDTTTVEWVRIGTLGSMNQGGTPTFDYLFFGASYTDNALRLYSDKKAYFGGTVGIGTTGPDAKLDVLSTTEQLRLTYTDGSVYTSFTTNSSGNLTITPSGGLVTFGDGIGIGVAASPNTSVYAVKTYTANTGSFFGFNFNPKLTPTADSTTGLYAFGVYPEITAHSFNASTLYGMMIQPKIYHTGGTLGSVFGVRVYPTFYAESAGTITNLYELYLSNPNLVAGSTEAVGTQYQLYIETPTRGSTNWSIYSVGGDNYFGGTVKAAGYLSADGSTGATGSFTTADAKTVTVKNGLITAIV